METEQIVEYLNDKISFVQIRGSIPLYWSQSPDIRYKPSLNIDLAKEHFSAALKHAETVLKTYGRHVYVNLVSFSVTSNVQFKFFIILNLTNRSTILARKSCWKKGLQH